MILPWLTTLEGRQFDRALAAVIDTPGFVTYSPWTDRFSRAAVTFTPPQAFDAARSIEDARLREDTMASVLREWTRHEPHAVREWLRENPVPPEVRRRLPMPSAAGPQ